MDGRGVVVSSFVGLILLLAVLQFAQDSAVQGYQEQQEYADLVAQAGAFAEQIEPGVFVPRDDVPMPPAQPVPERETPKFDALLASHVLRHQSVVDEAASEMTYDGHPFEYWVSILTYELNAELRFDAVRAVRRFGMNGRADEAADVLFQILNGYSLRTYGTYVENDVLESIAATIDDSLMPVEVANVDRQLIRATILALYELAPQVTEKLEQHARGQWTSLAPWLAVRFLSFETPEYSIPALFQLLRTGDGRAYGGFLPAYFILEDLKLHQEDPLLLQEAVVLVSEQPKWRADMLQLLDGVDGAEAALTSLERADTDSAAPTND